MSIQYDYYERKNDDGSATYLRVHNGVVDHVQRDVARVVKGAVVAYGFAQKTDEDKAMDGKTVAEIKALGFYHASTKIVETW